MTQSEALTILKTGANVFLTGEPGSGKTHTINAFVAWLRASDIEPAITAATGIAATHVGGMTIHSWSGIGVAKSLSRADVDRIASKEHIAKRVAKTDVLIIDEISMLSPEVLHMADAVCREVRRVDKPFGGLTVILVGDFFQLPPISREGEASFAYESHLWKELNLITCYLTDQYRQSDREYFELLTAIRGGQVTEEHLTLLKSRKIDESDAETDVPRLYSHNLDVDRLNEVELEKLPGTARTFRMTAQGKESFIEGLKRGCLSPETLQLKKGAVVMFTKNSPQGRFVNGTLGQVKEWDAAGYPVVLTKEGAQVTAEPMEWRIEEDGKVRASISQVPLRLAYAITVHKSQGMSMDAAFIDLSRAFEYGQGYVALSRLRGLQGLALSGFNERALQVHPKVLQKDREFRSASEAAQEAFDAMSPEEREKLQKSFVTAVGGTWKGDSIPESLEKERQSRIPTRLLETVRAVRDAENLDEAVRARGLTVGTVIKHLEELAAIGALVREDIAHLLSQEIAHEIQDALEATGADRLTPVFEALQGAHSFEAIRLARLMRAQAVIQ